VNLNPATKGGNHEISGNGGGDHIRLKGKRDGKNTFCEEGWTEQMSVKDIGGAKALIERKRKKVHPFESMQVKAHVGFAKLPRIQKESVVRRREEDYPFHNESSSKGKIQQQTTERGEENIERKGLK